MRNVRGQPWITPWYDGPAIGKDESYSRQLEDDRFACSLLRESILDLFARTANRYQISMDDAMACHLGNCSEVKRKPGTENVRKTAEMQRLAA